MMMGSPEHRQRHLPRPGSQTGGLAFPRCPSPCGKLVSSQTRRWLSPAELQRPGLPAYPLVPSSTSRAAISDLASLGPGT